MKIILLILITIIPQHSHALTAEDRLSDPIQEQRAHEIFKEIRCVVCSGESINDSKADIAKSLRILIRNQITQGKTNEQIISYISKRYGQSILMQTKLNRSTILLWLGPFIVLTIGAIGAAVFYRRSLHNNNN